MYLYITDSDFYTSAQRSCLCVRATDQGFSIPSEDTAGTGRDSPGWIAIRRGTRGSIGLRNRQNRALHNHSGVVIGRSKGEVVKVADPSGHHGCLLKTISTANLSFKTQDRLTSRCSCRHPSYRILSLLRRQRHYDQHPWRKYNVQR
jgi:hypothetical protein